MAQTFNITLRQLRAFAQAYQAENLTRAADELQITQSAMSALIRQFEESLGVQMFERTSRSLRPTKAAERAIAEAEDILSRVAAFESGVQRDAKSSASTLSFSCVPALASAIVPEVLAEFRRGMPGVQTDVYDGSDESLIERVLNEKSEFCINSLTRAPGTVDQISLLMDPVCVAFSRSSTLANLPTISWADLRNLALINLTAGSGLTQLIKEHVGRSAPNSGRDFDVSYIQTALAMASQNLGVVVLPAYLVNGCAHSSELALKPLHNPVIEQSLTIHTRKGHVLSGPAKAFLGLLRDRLTDRTLTSHVAPVH